MRWLPKKVIIFFIRLIGNNFSLKKIYTHIAAIISLSDSKIFCSVLKDCSMI